MPFDTNTQLPGGAGKLAMSNAMVSFEGGNVAFIAYGANGTEGLYTTMGGSLTKVLDTTDVIDGFGSFSRIFLSPQGVSGNTIGFSVQAASGLFGGYLATLEGVLPPSTIDIGGEVTQGTLLGGAGGDAAGGLDVDFGDSVVTGGTFEASYTTPDESTFAGSYAGTTGFNLGNFLTTGADGTFQVWDLDFTGELIDGATVTLQFKYDDAGLTAIQEDLLGIWHFGKYGPNGEDQWRWLRDSIDTSENIITITTDNFSPFAAGFQSLPEPLSLFVWGGLISVGAFKFTRRRRGDQPCTSPEGQDA